MSRDTTLAIDFGTSNSLVGAIHQGKKISALPIDPHAEDPTLMRTLLYFPNADKCFYGANAIQEFIEDDMQGRLFRSFKSHLPNAQYLGTAIDNRPMPLETMIGIFLLELKKRSEKILNTKVDRVVLGRPARYSMDDVADGFAVHRMKKAAEFAGFKEIEFVPEPLAAALDYRKQISEDKIVLIGDFGGGTSDFTIMKMGPHEFSREDVLAVDGCPLAGDALDSVFMSQRLNTYFGARTQYRLPLSSNLLKMPPTVVDRLNKPAHIVHLRERETYAFIQEVQKCALSEKDKAAIDRLFVLIEDQQAFSFFEEIERTKRNLSSNDQSDFHFDYPDIEVEEKFLRSEFGGWAEGTKQRIFDSLDRCLLSAGLQAQDIDLVCLTGGTAKVPFIQTEFETRFGKDRLQSRSYFHSVLSGLVESAYLSSQTR